MLFLKLLRGPAAPFVPDSAERVISALDGLLNIPIRWPETVTFEELNLEAPGSLTRILMRIAHEANDSSEN
jgi:hypothetical protein